MKREICRRAVIVSLSLLLCVSLFAVDFQVTDIKGNQVEVKDAAISFVVVRPETQNTTDAVGLPAAEGQGTVVIKWANIKSVTFSNIPDVLSLNMTITLTDGMTRSMLVKREGKVFGESKLGDFTIELSKVKSITLIASAEPHTK